MTRIRNEKPSLLLLFKISAFHADDIFLLQDDIQVFKITRHFVRSLNDF